MLREEAKRRLEEAHERISDLVEQRRISEALDAATQSCELARRVLGEKHLYYAGSLNALGQLQALNGDYQQAEIQLEQSVAVFRELLGDQHPQYLAALQRLEGVRIERAEASGTSIQRPEPAQSDTVFSDDIDSQIGRLNNEVSQLISSGRYQPALDLAQEACDFARRLLGPTHPRLGISVSYLASAHKTMGHFAEAEPLYEEALEILRISLGERHVAYAATLNGLGLLYVAMGRLSSAEPLYQRALDICGVTRGKDHPDYSACLNNLAALYEAQGRYSEAEPLYDRSLEIRKRALGEDHPDVAASMSNLAALYKAMARYEAAESFYRRALAIEREKLGTAHPSYATTLSNLGALLDATGNYVDADAYCLESLEAWRSAVGEQHPAFAAVLSNVSAMHSRMGDFQASEPLSRQALEISRRSLGEHHPDFAAALHNMAGVYGAMGRYSDAVGLYTQALDVWRETLGEEHPSFATGLSHLAGLYSSIDSLPAAERLYRQALEIRQRALGESHPDFAASVSNLALLHMQMGVYAAAESGFRLALDLTGRAVGEHHPRFAACLSNLAGFWRSRGDYVEAASLFRRALDIDRAALGDGHPEVADSRNNLGGIYRTVGDLGAAEEMFRQALDTRVKALGPTHPDVANSLVNLADVYAATHRADDALTLLLRAASIDEQTMGEVFSFGSESQRATHADAARVHQDLTLSLILEHFAGLPSAVCAAANLVFRRKGIEAEALAIQRDAIQGGRYPDLQPKLRDLRHLRMQIAKKVLAGPGAEPAKDHERVLREWYLHREALEVELARQIPELNVERALRTVDHGAIAAALPSDAVLVELVRVSLFDFTAIAGRGETQWNGHRYLAFVVTGGQPNDVQLLDLGDADAIDQLVAEFRTNLSGERDSRVQALPSGGSARGTALRKAVFDPLVVASGGRQRLVLAPDGDLTRLPFDTLPLAFGRYAIDDFRISYLSVGRDVLRFGLRRPSKAARSVVVADPDFDAIEMAAETDSTREGGAFRGGSGQVWGTSREWRALRHRHGKGLTFARLPGTRVEGEAVGRLLAVQPWVTGDALEARLKTCSSPRVLHLATHGFFLEDWNPGAIRAWPLNQYGTDGRPHLGSRFEGSMLRSGLALAGANTWLRGERPPPDAEDGILTAEDASGLDLLDTELVVLSACETGLGEVQMGEGVFGLRRAFVAAGARALVMSLWKIPDDATQELMVEFYERMLIRRPRQPAPDALRSAQLSIRDKYCDPYYWGAFIYQGDPESTAIA